MDGKNKTTNRRRMTTFAVLLLGFVIGKMLDWPTETDARVSSVASKPKDKSKAFLSGSERSVTVLKEISKTLKQIETRVADIEKHLKRQAKK